MNLPLHYGFLGVLEAGLIAFLVGVLMYLLWRALSRFFEFSDPLAIGWALGTATLLAAGYDTWNMFYLGMVKLESTLYARLALQGIHNPEMLGTRVIVQAMAAWAGVVVAWIVLHRRLPFSETGDAGNEGGQ